jgi:two-component system sensor histidine kinase VicK
VERKIIAAKCGRHPLKECGGSARDTYAEIWDTIGPMFAGVMAGQTHGAADFMVPLDRNCHLEDCYFDFSTALSLTWKGKCRV